MLDKIKERMSAFGLADLARAALLFVVVTIVISLGAYVLSQVSTTVFNNYVSQGYNGSTGCLTNCAKNQAAYNVTVQGLNGLTTFGSWLPIIAIVIVAAIVIGLLVGLFGGGRGEEL